MATPTNPFKVIGGGRDQDQEDGDETSPAGEPKIHLGKLKTKSVYLFSDPYEAGIARLKWYAGTRRYQLSDVLSALFDLAADHVEELDDYMLKYEKARRQNAEQSAS